MGLVAFVANGSILPRKSGVDDRPMDRGAIPFKSPAELEVEIELPNRDQKRTAGTGGPQGAAEAAGQQVAAQTATATAPAGNGAAQLPPVAEEIDIAAFQKVDLRVARVLAAERIQGADRLLKLQLDLGFEKRQVVAGIAQHYRPEELVGRNLIVVANLKPAKLRGELSQGMILAATGPDGRVVVLTTAADVAPGSKVK